jgi:hypothetical protein
VPQVSWFPARGPLQATAQTTALNSKTFDAALHSGKNRGHHLCLLTSGHMNVVREGARGRPTPRP